MNAEFGGASTVPFVRAVVIHETGGPEVLQIEQVPDPEPKASQVLVRVEAAGVNRFDLNQRKGGASSFPLVLGNPGDAAGRAPTPAPAWWSRGEGVLRRAHGR